jgi:hypothetical protein
MHPREGIRSHGVWMSGCMLLVSSGHSVWPSISTFTLYAVRCGAIPFRAIVEFFAVQYFLKNCYCALELIDMSQNVSTCESNRLIKGVIRNGFFL